MAADKQATRPRARKSPAGAAKAKPEGKAPATRKPRQSAAKHAAAKAPVSGRKGGAEKVHTPVEAPDSVRSVARAKLLFALGEGEFAGNLDGRRIKLDGTPLIAADGTENFPGVKWEFRPGTQHQDHIAGLPAVESETSVGVELRSDTPWVRSLTNPDLSAARLRLSWPALQQQLSNGDVVGYRIDYAIDLSVDGGPWVEVLNQTLNDKTTSKYERSHRIDLPKTAGGWSLRVRRLTENSKLNTISDTMRIEAITEVIDAKLRYPNTALLYIEFDSSQFQNIPKLSCEPDMRIIRVPSNYDPLTRTYTGLWDGVFKWAYSNNPAWVLYDLVLNKRFGMGRRLDLSMVDRWELYEIARYCDELVSDGKGGMEPRFTCNVYIQSRADAWTVLRDIAAIFRGITYWSGSEMVFQADRPSDVEFVFSRSNVTDGKFRYTSQSEKTRYSSALVSWDNPDNAYESEPEPVSIPGLVRRYGFNQIEVTAVGCTRQSEANRRGRWLLLTNSSDRGVTFNTGLEGYLPKPGRIIGVADALLAGRQLGGRISQATLNQITVDRNVQVKAGDRLIVNLPSGKAEARTVKAVAGRSVTVTADFSELPRAQAQWGVESSDLVIQQYRVTKVDRAGSSFEVSGVLHDPGKFSQVDSGSRLEPRPISVVPARTQQAPSAVTVTSFTRTEQGLAVTTLRAAWAAAPGAVAYQAEWRKDSGAWIAAPRTSALGFEVPGIYAGRYMVRVRAVNALEVSSLPAYSDETQFNGKEGAPPALASFTTSVLHWAIGLAWTFPADADDTRYIEVQQNKANQDEGATLLGLFPYPQRGYEITGLAPGIIKFLRARLVDTSGNVGAWTGWVSGQSSSSASDYLEIITEDIVKGALGPGLFSRIDLIDGDGPGSVNARVKVVSDQLKTATDELNQRIDEIGDEYLPAKQYEPGQIVRRNDRLYQALVVVPENTPPPNGNYWKDIGELLGDAQATALQVQQNTADISAAAATASQLQALQAAWRDDNGEGQLADAMESWDSAAKFADEVRVRATQNEATVSRLTSLDAKVDDHTAGITSLEQVIASNEQATASRIVQLGTEVDDNTSHIQEVSEALSDTNQAVASLMTSIESVYTAGREDSGEGELTGALDAWKTKAKFATDLRTLADADQAQVRKSETLEASLSQTNASLTQTSASVQQVSEAVVGLDGKVRAQTTIKTQTVANGRRVMAALSVGTDGDTSEVSVFAQRFAVVDEVGGQVVVPLVVQNGQLIINTALISKAFIQEIVAGLTIKSAVLNSLGQPLLEINFAAGTFVLRGQDANGSTLLNNGGLYVYDANGIERTAVGRLT